MPNPRRIFLYPNTPFDRQEGANDYMDRLRGALQGPFCVVNKSTRLGLLDLARHLHETDIVYFNWIEDLADKRFGYVQLALLLPLLLFCRATGRQVVWFVHNAVSHSRRNWLAKRYTAALMARLATTVLAHAGEAAASAGGRKVIVFDHPVAGLEAPAPEQPSWDILIWGSVSAYKGVLEFVQLHAKRPELHRLKVLVAGRFASAEYFREVSAAAHPGVTIWNRVLPEEELQRLFAQSRFVLFAYRPASVLGSGALSKTLMSGRPVIGPARGAFDSLGRKGLIHTYRDQDDLARLLSRLDELAPAEASELQRYADAHSWANFGAFLEQTLQAQEERAGWGFVLR